MNSDRVQASSAVDWNRVIRVEALGTDTFGPFELWINVTTEDGVMHAYYPFTPGYKKLIEELPRRFPHLEPDWKEAMAETPWHVERLIYVKGPVG
jgi:hypothetical protein